MINYFKMKNFLNPKFILLVIGISLLFVALLTIPTFVLWNWLMPDIFGLPKIGILQALGLNLLSMIFFKKFDSSSKD